MAYRFCVYCGERVTPAFRFCPKCGKPVSNAAPVTVASAPAAVVKEAAPVVSVAGERPPQYGDPQFLAVAVPPAVEYVDEPVETPAEEPVAEAAVEETSFEEAPVETAPVLFAGENVCPACGGAVHGQAVLCVHCGRMLRDVKTGKKL